MEMQHLLLAIALRNYSNAKKRKKIQPRLAVRIVQPSIPLYLVPFFPFQACQFGVFKIV